jgi:hypothetical protein
MLCYVLCDCTECLDVCEMVCQQVRCQGLPALPSITQKP